MCASPKFISFSLPFVHFSLQCISFGLYFCAFSPNVLPLIYSLCIFLRFTLSAFIYQFIPLSLYFMHFSLSSRIVFLFVCLWFCLCYFFLFVPMRIRDVKCKLITSLVTDRHCGLKRDAVYLSYASPHLSQQSDELPVTTRTGESLLPPPPPPPPSSPPPPPLSPR